MDRNSSKGDIIARRLDQTDDGQKRFHAGTLAIVLAPADGQMGNLNLYANQAYQSKELPLSDHIMAC